MIFRRGDNDSVEGVIVDKGHGFDDFDFLGAYPQYLDAIFVQFIYKTATPLMSVIFPPLLILMASSQAEAMLIAR